MLRVWQSDFDREEARLCVASGTDVVYGLREDTAYVLEGSSPQVDAELYVDDVRLAPNKQGHYQWRTSFFAGRVRAQWVHRGQSLRHCWLDVGPNLRKASDECFARMVQEVRDEQSTLLGGLSSASLAFGREGRAPRLVDRLRLARVRLHGPDFVAQLQTIARAPHRSVRGVSRELPLSQIRRLPASALQDRRLAALARGTAELADLEEVQLRVIAASATVDTPANRTLLALARRLRGLVVYLQGVLDTGRVDIDKDDALARASWRTRSLAQLHEQLYELTSRAPFAQVREAQVSAAGLTQVAAHPAYSRAYRLGVRSLAVGMGGTYDQDQIPVHPSWGIYETWCYLATLRALARATGVQPQPCKPGAASAELAHKFDMGPKGCLYTFFQAVFPALRPPARRLAWSISGERRPDIVLLREDGAQRHWMALDAKWRSGRDNELDAMSSAHIYHDALRVGETAPFACALLLPAQAEVSELGEPGYIDAHGVGAVYQVAPAQAGEAQLSQLLRRWLYRDQ